MASKKHLIFFSEHLLLGGAPQAQIEFLRSIDTDRYDVSLVVEHDPGPDNHLLAQVPLKIPVRFLFPKSEYPLEIFPRMYNSTFWKLLRRHSEKVDIILRIKEVLGGLRAGDVLIGFTLTFAKYLPFFKQYKLLYWIHGPKSQMGRLELLKFYQRIRHFDRILVVSESLRQQICILLPKLAFRLKAIYTPIDFQVIEEKANDFSELSESELKLIREQYFVAVTRFVPEKDVECLVKAWGLLKQHQFAPKLVIVGDGSGRAKVESLIQKYDVSEKVFLIGAKKNPFVWMKHSLALVHAAKSEGFGLVLVEAMGLGKAVISSDCPVGPTEILQNGQCGLLVKVGDATEFADKVRLLESDNQLRIDLEQKSLIRARDFSAEKSLPKFYQLIESLW